MDYKVEAGNLSEKVKREVAIIIASPTVLDEKTWDAMDVAAPVLAGHLSDPAVGDCTNPESIVWYFEGDFPVSLDIGTPIVCSVIGHNDSNVTIRMTLTLEIVDPDGVVRATISPTRSVELGGQEERQVPYSPDVVVLDKAGIWKFHTMLEGEV